ncbi:MAG: DUF5916 domain-containing protein [Myxococcota bacterium]
MELVWLIAALAQPAAAAPGASVVTTAEPIVVDGVLDEPVWQSAPPVTDFLRFQPTEGGAPPGITEVRFAQDDRAFYVGIRVDDLDYVVRARVSARERINADDQIGIYLDTFHDGRSGYIFYHNPRGIQQDIRHNSGQWNVNWDTAYRSAGTVDDDGHGYSIELAFPWRSLKFPKPDPEHGQTWGFIVTRKVPHEGTKYAFPDITRGKPLLFSEEAELVGVRPPARGSGVELIPAATVALQWLPDDEGRLPDFYRVPEDWLRLSLDTRLGITPDLGFAATLNPDFSQVESDLADVRLNARFAFRFQERRPFFLDGIDFFNDDFATLYSRSIAEPLYGVKLSGREGPWSLGLVHALDRSPLPSAHENGAVGFNAEDVEDRFASSTLARIKLDAFDDGWVGVTLADKRLVGTPNRPGQGGDHQSLGADLGIPIGRSWITRAAVQASRTAGPTDPNVPLGYAVQGSIARSPGVGTGGSIWSTVRTAPFRQELGFLNQSALVRTDAELFHIFAPRGAVSTVTPSVGLTWLEEFDGDFFRSVNLGQQVLIRGIHSLSLTGDLRRRRQTGAVVDGYRAQLRYSGQVGRWLEWSPSLFALRSLDFGTLGPATSQGASLGTTLRVARGRLDTDVQLSQFQPLGESVERSRLIRSTFIWQFTNRTGVRLLVQDSQRSQAEGVEQQLVISPLLTWIDVPGTALFVGFTEQIDRQTRRTLQRVAFVKFSKLLRL